MALAAEILELTKHMAPDDAKLFENLVTKDANKEFEKALREGVLRQSDYDRKMNEGKQRLTAAEETAAKWKNWADENIPIHESTLASYTALEAQKTELMAKLAEAEAARTASGGGDTVDAAELERRVNETVGKLGYVSRADMDKIISEQTGKLAREEATREVNLASKKFYEETLPSSVNFSMDVTELAWDHKQEFGGNIDRAAFSQFMKDRNMLEPKKAYEEFVRPQRDKKTQEKAIADAVKAKQDELQQQYSAAGLPGGGMMPPGLQPKGAMQMKIERDAAAAASAGSLATSIAASEAAKELRGEGKM